MRIESRVQYNERAHAESIRRAQREATAAAIESVRATLPQASNLDLDLIFAALALAATGALVGAFFL